MCMSVTFRKPSTRAFREAEGITSQCCVDIAVALAPAVLLPYYYSSRGAPLLAPWVAHPPSLSSRLRTCPTGSVTAYIAVAEVTHAHDTPPPCGLRHTPSEQRVPDWCRAAAAPPAASRGTAGRAA
ncbi:hypothetical protein HYPSUDRAFT_465493 [Hypholoma sublateritium FD-334 SS-4]|uniref:Uncharacterized protein n=1 Tax=Hypholoma sublateritium (strain FD-334 SS-4) TaxID=945553 RepID=A0A0D2PZL3_HYPSF|nr:hypothetical protein HYPSUDRAFT_465493 [Hypholoma sublateritium FD-334 SS-4]